VLLAAYAAVLLEKYGKVRVVLLDTHLAVAQGHSRQDVMQFIPVAHVRHQHLL